MTTVDAAEPDDKGISRSTRTARNVLLIAYACTGILVAALTVERIQFEDASERAVQRTRTALRIEDSLLLEDERRTLSANLAAATGDRQWIASHDAHRPGEESRGRMLRG